MLRDFLYAVLIADIVGALLYFYGNKTENSKALRTAFILAIISGIFNLAILIVRWKLSGRLPLASGSEFVLCFSCFTILLYLVYEIKSGDKKAGGIILVICSVLVLSILTLMTDQLYTVQPLMPSLKSPWLAVHVSTAVLAYATFTLAAGLAARNILRKNYYGREKSIYLIVAGGFSLLSMSIILGAAWAEQTWGTYWSWDPKETWALITWIIYALYLHLHRKQNWQGKRANIIVLAGFILVLFTFFGVNYLMASLHSYA